MAKLNAAKRNALPKSDFALPEKAPKSGSYPIDTSARARSALSRAAANASPEEQARIRHKVKAKYPAMRIDSGIARD